MNIESTTANITKTTEAQTTVSAANSSAKDSQTTFKDELESVKTNDKTVPKDNKMTDEQKIVDAQSNNSETQNLQNSQKSVLENMSSQLAKDKLKTNTDKDKKDDKISEKSDNSKISNPLNELNSKIAALSEIKTEFVTKHQNNSSIDQVGKTNNKDYCQTIKMDKQDALFFVNLVDNQQMTAQSSQVNNNINQNGNINFTEVKAEATQSVVQVSQTLIDALNNSAQTGKPFRIDFDNDIAVIMKVDKQGNLSANFIPGSAAVENYLRNNIEGLKQSFAEQGLQYNELTYSNQQKQQKQQKQKENEDE